MVTFSGVEGSQEQLPLVFSLTLLVEHLGTRVHLI